MIVEDDEQGLYMLRALLEGHGHEVMEASDGARALEEARRDPPDIIISDILMPVMDGFALCREWKGDDSLKNIPFIFYTATYTDPKDEEFAMKLGADRFITKPAEPDEFISILQGVITDMEMDRLEPEKPPLKDENEIFKLYNQRLIVKLEQKMLDLEREVADRKRAQEELRESEEKYRELVQNSNSMIIRFDTRGNITFFNEFAQRFFGYQAHELLGKNIVGTFVPDKEVNRKDLAEIIEEIVSNPEQNKTREYRNMRRDGHRAWVAWTNKPIMDDSGKVTEILGVGVDVTARREIQRNMERLNHLFLGLGPDIIDNIEAILQTGMEILGGRLIQYCRLQKGRLSSISFPPGENSFSVADRPEGHVCSVVLSVCGDEPVIIDDLRGTHLENAHPEIQQHGYRSFAGYPVRLRGEVIGCLSLWSRRPRKLSHDELDIMGTFARIISIEEERLAREEDIKDLVDVASHELRHPLTLIKGYAMSLKELWGNLDEESRVKMLDIINLGADRMEKVVRELLNVSHIERGRFKLYRQELPLGPLIERAISEMRDKGMRNTVNISVSAGTGTLGVDPERLVELLVALLDNAIEYSPPGADIDIEVEAGDEEALISVLDRGQGISEWDRERIFERFYQVEEAIHHSKPGIGLGLYIAKEIVEAHGGRIWCEPRAGGGSAFNFTLPA